MSMLRTVALSPSSSMVGPAPIPDDPAFDVPCNATRFFQAVYELHEVSAEMGPVVSFKVRLARFTQQLQVWEKKYGKGVIQRAMADSIKPAMQPHDLGNVVTVLDMLLGQFYQQSPELKVPFCVKMSVLIPYLKSDPQSDPEAVDAQKMPFAVNNVRDPGKRMRNLVINMVSDPHKMAPSQRGTSLCEFIGLLATLSSQPGGHEVIQDALFEKNSDGKSVFHYLFMGHSKGYQLRPALYIIGLLWAFNLDVKRFNREHSHSLADCLMAEIAIHTSALAHPSQHERDVRQFYYRLLSELFIWAIPPCLSVATPEDLSHASAGVLSGRRYQAGEAWLCLTPADAPDHRIIEPFSWFKTRIKDTPYIQHPTRHTPIQWSGDDLYRLGIMSMVDCADGVRWVKSFKRESGEPTIQYYDRSWLYHAQLQQLKDKWIQAGMLSREQAYASTMSESLVVGCGVSRQLVVPTSTLTPSDRIAWIALGCGCQSVMMAGRIMPVYSFEIRVDEKNRVLIKSPQREVMLDQATPKVVMGHLLAPAADMPRPAGGISRRVTGNAPIHQGDASCTPDTLSQLVTQLLGVESLPDPLLVSTQRMSAFTNQLQRWAATDGRGAIQHALLAPTTDGRGSALRQLVTPLDGHRPILRAPLWMIMDALIPYLAWQAEDETHSRLLPFSFPSEYLDNPGHHVRNLVTSYVSTAKRDDRSEQSLHELIGLLATLSSKPDGQRLVQNALFGRNEAQQSALSMGLMSAYQGGRPGSCGDDPAMTLFQLFRSFKLDLRRINRLYPYTFLQCLMARLIVSLPDAPAQPVLADRLVTQSIQALNAFCFHFRPTHLSLATQDDLKGASAGARSGISPVASTEQWLVMVPIEDSQPPIIEPRSWFQQHVTRHPFLHPITKEPIEWGGDDLFWLGIQTVIGNRGIEWVQSNDRADQGGGVLSSRQHMMGWGVMPAYNRRTGTVSLIQLGGGHASEVGDGKGAVVGDPMGHPFWITILPGNQLSLNRPHHDPQVLKDEHVLSHMLTWVA